MNEMGDSMARSTDAVEALLERAAPRPTPPDEIETKIRDAVRVEWMVTRKRRVRRHFTVGFGMAAAVMLALAISFSGFRQSGVVPVEVATIDRSVGTLYVQSGDSVQTTIASTASINAGQIMTTGRGSAAGLTWLEGGSLRIDGDTRIAFSAGNEVFLHKGRVYFDSAGSGPGSGLSIRTTHGIVSHVGTQYMTESNAANLIVSVREGQVSIDGTYHDQAAYEGQRVQMTGSARPSVTNTSGAGSEWQWIEAVSPNISVDGMSAHEFLQWVGRETGHGVEYESESAEILARSTQLKGSVVASPREELRLRMMTVDLDAKFDPEGPVIIVTD